MVLCSMASAGGKKECISVVDDNTTDNVEIQKMVCHVYAGTV